MLDPWDNLIQGWDIGQRNDGARGEVAALLGTMKTTVVRYLLREKKAACARTNDAELLYKGKDFAQTDLA